MVWGDEMESIIDLEEGHDRDRNTDWRYFFTANDIAKVASEAENVRYARMKFSIGEKDDE